MKKFKNLTNSLIRLICLILAITCITIQSKSQMPDAITISPEGASVWDEITLTLDAKLSCPDNALFGADSVMMHSGVTIAGLAWQNVIVFDALGVNGQQPKLIHNGDSTWSITYTPADFYGIDNYNFLHRRNLLFL